MIANRFRSVGWTGCVCVAALSFYLVSQTVATKRAELATVDRRIASTEREIRQLETEIGTRGGMAQIENWNSRVYGLQAPGAAQFVHSTGQLMAMADPQPQPLEPGVAAPHLDVQQASLTTVAPAPAPQVAPDVAPAVDVAPSSQPMIRQATFVQPKRQAMAIGTSDVHAISAPVEVDPVVSKPAVKAAAPKAKGAPKAPAVAAVVLKAKPKEPKARPVTKMTSLDDSWLADVTGEPTKRSHKGRP